MSLRGKQSHALDHRLLLVVVIGLETGDDGMARGSGVPRCMLTRRGVAASDVTALSTSTEVKPPAIRRRKALRTSISSRPGLEVDSARIFSHDRHRYLLRYIQGTSNTFPIPPFSTSA